MKPLLAPKDNLCLFYYRDNRALAYDIGGFFCRKINNIRNELEIVKTALKEDDKVKCDPEVMEIYIYMSLYMIYIYMSLYMIYTYEFIYDIYIYEFIYDIYVSFVSFLVEMSAALSRSQQKRPVPSTQY